MKETLKKVRAHLKAQNVRFFFDRETRTIHTWKTGDHGQFRVEINPAMNDTGLMCHAVFPIMAPEALKPAMASLLARLNYELAWGSFGMDPSDGEIRFRTTIPVTEGAFIEQDLDYLIHVNAIILDSHFPELLGALGSGVAEAVGPEQLSPDSAARFEWN